jgi:DNA-binding response OmpR family regulator
MPVRATPDLRDRRCQLVSKVLLLTGTSDSAAEILPSLSLLDHAVRLAPAVADSVLGWSDGDHRQASGSAPDAVLVDARGDLVRVSQLLRRLGGLDVPLLVVIGEGGWAAVSTDWGADDVILHSAGPSEVEARIRLAIGRAAAVAGRSAGAPGGGAEEVRSGELVIDEVTYSARIRGVTLDLTFKEFELLKFLAQHPRRVFTRSQLLQEVWGYDYFGGTRTVDVHVRRLRAKLGAENEALIGTVRNVGYKFVPAKAAPSKAPSPRAAPASAPASGPAGEQQGGRANGAAAESNIRSDQRGART